MNPRLHDEYVALCALFYSGEISEEEWALLQVHMAYCDSCRSTFEEFKHVAREVIPAMASVAANEGASVPRESNEAFDDARRRMMSRLEVAPHVNKPPVPKRAPWRVFGGALAACVAGLLILIGVYALGKKSAPSQVPDPQPASARTTVQPSESLPATGDAKALAVKDSEIAQLHQQIDTLKTGSAESQSAVNALQQKLQDEQAQREQIATEKQSLDQQLQTAQATIQSLHGQLGSSQASSGQQGAQVASLETKVRTLNAALEDANNALDSKDRMLALDKDFLAHDKDIRDLIGARNLYIADIYDTTETGKTAKPFGRIFYTQDRSLVFYGFDLEKQGGLTHSVAFQAWGSGTDRQPVSLGLFYQDDSHKRWVVRCDDAKTLARLNMVFVTIEPPGGSSKPTGKQLLRAYLQIQPNHP